jgi:hypothetical protein
MALALEKKLLPPMLDEEETPFPASHSEIPRDK